MFEKIKGLKGIFYKKIKEAAKPEIEEVIPGFAIKKPKRIVELPKVEDITKINVTYPLIEPFAYANIKWVPETKELNYFVIEPKLTKEEEQLLKRISDGLIELVEVGLSAIKEPSKAIEYLEKNVAKVIKEFGISLTKEQYIKIMYYIYRNFIGYNEIEPLLQDPNIEDISCDGVEIPLYVIHRKFGSLKTNVVFENLDDLREFIIKLAERCGRYVSYAEPILAGTLPDGSRVSATLAGDVATHGPVFTLRKFGEKPLSPVDQIELKTASPELLAYLWYLVEHGASMLIIGGVATGKCIAPGDLIQLANGEVKAIDEVYEKVVKSNPCPKIELLTLAPDLKLLPVRINKFWKMESPPVLVKIKTESGCDVTTTPEHEFLCLRDGKIGRVRSDRLKKGDYLASPGKIKITGRKQRINLSDWVDEKIYVPRSEPVLDILSKARKKYGSTIALSRAINLNKNRVEGWNKKNSVPILIFKKLCEELGCEIEGKVDLVKSKTGSKPIPVKLIKNTSPELLKLVGYVIGDGGVYDNGIQFFNTSKALRKEFVSLVKKFGLSAREEFQRKRTPKIIVQNKPFEIFLTKVFNIPKNSKSSIVDVPDIVMRCSNAEISEFLKALFDSEASVSVKECKIEFSTASRNLAYKISSLLRRFGIVGRIREKKVNKTYYRVVVSGKKDLEKYRKNIGFTDPQKKKLLDEIIRRTKKYHTNVDVVPVGKLLKEIIEENNLSIESVARRARIARESLRDVIHEKTNPSRELLKKIIKGLRGVNSEKISYLNLLSKSDIFWDRVRKVERLLGNGFVYDFTVDGTHNFVAGNGGGLIVSNTSFLNTVCMFIPPEAKIVSIEDTRELRIPNEHWVPTLARVGFGIPMPTGEKYGSVSLFDLLKESFRQNPDYVILGESRGPEAYVMFQGMSSGHPSLSTFHAGSVDTLIKRLTTPPIELSPTLIESLDVVIVMVHAREKGKSARRIKEVVEIESVDPKTEEVKSRVIFRWNPVTDTHEKVEESIKIGKIAAAKGGTERDALEEIQRRARILEWLKEKGIKDFLENVKYINMYYKEPSKLFEIIGEEFKAKPTPPAIAPMIPTRIPIAEEKEKKEKKERERVSLLSLLGFKILREK